MTNAVFGYYALETGVLAGAQTFLQESRVANRFVLGSQLQENVDVLGEPEYLPFAFSNLDLVVASHALDCSPQPHQVLREIERVLVPEGHCILLGFNPLSCKGLAHLWQYKRNPCRIYSTFRVREWLNVLGFDVLETVSFGFSPILGGERLFQRTRWLDVIGEKSGLGVGNVYLIHAQKKVSNMTLLPTSRKTVPVLRPKIAAGAGRISQREPMHDK